MDITVTTSNETSATSAADQFNYLPTVTGVSPATGPAGGGTIVTISGAGFASGSTVEFGSANATNVSYNSATQQLTATAPAGAGIEDVTVTTSGETSAKSSLDQFTFLPSVTGVSPTSGPAGGGTSVVITGTGFNATSSVDFGTAAATSDTYNSATQQLTATAPAGTVGITDVTVTTAQEPPPSRPATSSPTCPACRASAPARARWAAAPA